MSTCYSFYNILLHVPPHEEFWGQGVQFHQCYTLNLERNWDIISMFTCNLKTVLAAGDNFGWKHLAHLSE